MHPPPAPRELWLVRHGQSEGNIARDLAEASGHLRVAIDARDPDVALSDLGGAQADAIGTWLRSAGPFVIIASPFVRTLQTATRIARSMADGADAPPVEVDERIRDRDMGILDGLTWAGIQKDLPSEARRAERVGRFYYRPPGGESWADILLRLRQFLSEAAARPEERMLLITHDVVIQLTRALLTGLSESESTELILSTTYANCALTRLERTSGGYDVVSYNDVEPLADVQLPVTENADAAAPLG